MTEGSSPRPLGSNGGISSFPLTLLQAELHEQRPPSRKSLPAGLKSNTSSAVVYNPPVVQSPIVRQSTPNSQQQQQQQQTFHTPRGQETPLRATTPTRQQQRQQHHSPPPSQPQTPRMVPLGQTLQIPPPPIPGMRTSLCSQNVLKQQPPAHKQQQSSQQRRPSDGMPPQQRPRTRLCADYSTSPRQCIHSCVGPVGAWHRGSGGAVGTNHDRGATTPNKSQSTPASAPTSPLLSARR